MDADRRRTVRLIAAAVGGALIAAAATIFVVTVDVDASARSAPCGSGWDVVAGRTGWREWWAQDLAAPVRGAPLLRTHDCPGAVNARIVAAAVLAVAAVAAFAIGAAVAPRQRSRTGFARRLHVLGTAVTAVGSVLVLAGIAGILLLTADPGATLFLYVGRPTVVLLGLLLLLPAVLLVVLGRGASLLADQFSRGDAPDESS